MRIQSCGKKKVNSIIEVNAIIIWRKFQKKTLDYEYYSEPLRQQRRFVEGGYFKEKDSETAETAKSKNRTEKLIQFLINN